MKNVHKYILTNDISDKERYEKELKQLVSHSDDIKKPKKCLSAYMIFVKEVCIQLIISYLNKRGFFQTRPTIVDANPEMGAL